MPGASPTNPNPLPPTPPQLTALWSLLLWNTPYAILFALRSRAPASAPSFFDRCVHTMRADSLSTVPSLHLPNSKPPSSSPPPTRPTRTNSYLIQPPPPPAGADSPKATAAGSTKGQPTGWAEFRESLEHMAGQILFLWALLCFGGGSAAMLGARWVER